MSEKSCDNCTHSGTYTIYKYPVCWLKTADLPEEYVWFLDKNSVICEDYEEKKEK